MNNLVRALTYDEIQELKDFCNIATQGEWINEGCDVRKKDFNEVWDVKYICACNFTMNMSYEERENNAKFIAKFNPYMIQCLIKSYEEMYKAYKNRNV